VLPPLKVIQVFIQLVVEKSLNPSSINGKNIYVEDMDMLASTPIDKSQKEAANTITKTSSTTMKNVSKKTNNPSTAAMKSVNIL